MTTAAGNAIGITQVSVPRTITDKSSTVATGGVAQTLMAANTVRRGFWVQNVSTSDLYINDQGDAAATGASLKIPSGALYECPSHAVPTSAISIYGATTAQAFAAREW